jgi:hypothetical protein
MIYVIRSYICLKDQLHFYYQPQQLVLLACLLSFKSLNRVTVILPVIFVAH